MCEIYSREIEIQTTDTDFYDNLRPGAILQYFQAVGTAHAAQLNMGRDYLVEKYHASWILVRVWYHVLRPIHAGEIMRMDTWHRGASGIIFNRDFEMYIGEEKVGEGISAWVVADVDTRKMLRPSAIDTIAGAQVPQRVGNKQLKLIREPDEKVWVYDRCVRYGDIDVNGHMNNTRYADVLMDALSPEELKDRFISQLQLNYSQECLMGETMKISRFMDGANCYIDGCCGDGERRFEAKLQFQNVSGNFLDEVKEKE